tara:strand:- start:285 stop:458 length:174 start_codon:yes stop_codon:yes gene_type:complete
MPLQLQMVILLLPLELVELDQMAEEILILIKVVTQFFQLLQAPAVAAEYLTDQELET